MKIAACNFFQNSKQKNEPSIHKRLTPKKFNESTTSTPMTPNTRKWKSRLAEDLTDFISCIGSEADQVKVLFLSLWQLDLLGAFQTDRKPTKAGRWITPTETSKAVWHFWHDKSTVSTLTSCPVKLKLSHKPKNSDWLEIYWNSADIRKLLAHKILWINFADFIADPQRTVQWVSTKP